ncbi:HD family phosphohydrolase [Elusimicrobiota bacterium]
MPIINSKKISEISKDRILLITTVFLGILIIASAIVYMKENIPGIMGMIIFSLVVFILSVLLLKIFYRDLFKTPHKIILIEIIIIMMIAFVIIVETSPNLSRYFIPSASAGILLAVLLSPGLALAGVIIVALLAGVMGDFSLGSFFVLISGGIAAIYSSGNVRNRKDLNRSGLSILMANSAAILAVDLLSGFSVANIGLDIAWGAGNAFISIVIASGMLPILESVFTITTNIRLLELGDFNQPLLKKLMLEAPGTYHHSLMVGNLVDDACEKIGANSLLARVGAYYHDIGKLTNPQYFIENRTHNKDAHKNLKPNFSALILKRHVKDGLTLAEEYKLDKVIKDFIEQHHGKTLMEYFYRKVIEEVKDKDKIDEKDYRYPGPRPMSKEAGVLMLADSVEAACRTLDDPTYSRMSGLVTKIINNKFIDKQLNHCNITLSNLDDIHKSFTKTLSGIHHSRIEYPEDKEEN